MSWATSPPNKIEIRLGFPDKPRVVEWLVREAKQSSMLVRTPGGDIWMSAEKWRSEGPPRPLFGDLCTPETCDATVEKVLSFLRTLPWVRGNERVPVQSVMAGKTGMSRKVKLRVVVEEPGREPRTLTREKTVPTSLLKRGDDDVWTLPKWKVDEIIQVPGEKVWTLPWTGMAAIEAELRMAAALAKADVIKAQQERAEQQACREAEAVVRAAAQAALEASRQARDAELRRLAEEDGEFALAFAKLRLTLSDLADLGVRLDRWPRWIPADGLDANADGSSVIHEIKAYQVIGGIVEAVRKRDDFLSWRERNKARAGGLLKAARAPAPRARVPDRVFRNSTVHWTEWVGPSSNRKRVDHVDQGCNVEVYGQKNEIELPDGTVITKMVGQNLKIIPAAAEKSAEAPTSCAETLPNG